MRCCDDCERCDLFFSLDECDYERSEISILDDYEERDTYFNSQNSKLRNYCGD